MKLAPLTKTQAEFLSTLNEFNEGAAFLYEVSARMKGICRQPTVNNLIGRGMIAPYSGGRYMITRVGQFALGR